MFVLGFAPFALLNCTRPTEMQPHWVPEPFNDVRPEGIEARASAVFVETPDGTPTIALDVTFVNPAPTAVVLEFLGGSCFVRILVYTQSVLQPLWNGLSVNCPDIARTLLLPAADSVTVRHVVDVPTSIGSALKRQPLFALAVLKLNSHVRSLGVNAGQVQVNIPDG